MIHPLFNYNKWESVKAVLLGLGRLNVSHLIMLRKVNFYRHLYTSKNRRLSCALRSFMLRRCDVMANSVFTALHAMQRGLNDEISVRLSVRLSVCLSNACIVTKRKKDMF